jgi:glycosyltransferase involved in cell wall biosynthesis
VHILQIYKDYPPVIGGIEHHLRDLSEGLVARGHTVTVLVTARGRETSVSQPHERLSIIRAARALHAASTPLSLSQIVRARAIRADLVHLHFPFPPGDLAARAAGGAPPLILTYHSDIVRQRRLLALYQPLLQRTLRRARRILATSPAYIESSPFLRPHAAKCQVVPLGVDAERFARPDPDRVAALRALTAPHPTALFVGRLRYYKGLHLLLEALSQVPDVRLLVVGSGPEQGALQQQARDLGLAERIHWLGDLADELLPAAHRAADFFVLPAHLRAEAFGIAQLEALASGLPCISTEIGTGTSFVNAHGETGLVVPGGDVAALAQAIRLLADDPGLRAACAARARQRAVDRFSLSRMLDDVEQIYADVAAEA